MIESSQNQHSETTVSESVEPKAEASTIQEPGLTLAGAAMSALGGASSVLRDAIVFAVVAYVIGWVTATTYYSFFGAVWILPQLSQLEILEFSFRPLVLLISLGFIVATAAGDYWTKTGLFRYAAQFVGVTLLWQLGGALLRASNRWDGVVANVDYLLAFVIVILAVVALKIRHGQGPVGVRGEGLAGLVTMGVLFALPVTSGFASAKLTCSKSNPELPRVRLKSDADTSELLLLRLDEHRAFLIEATAPCGTSPVHLVDPDDIKLVERAKAKEPPPAAGAGPAEGPAKIQSEELPSETPIGPPAPAVEPERGAKP